jgi:hypothetical protein
MYSAADVLQTLAATEATIASRHLTSTLKCNAD